MRDDRSSTLPPTEVLAALRRWPRHPQLRSPTWRLSQALAKANVEFLVNTLATTPRGDHAPPDEIIRALCRPRWGSGPGPNGGTQRIVHRYSEAARDEIVHRIARRKREGGVPSHLGDFIGDDAAGILY
jgi:hypothetical protein